MEAKLPGRSKEAYLTHYTAQKLHLQWKWQKATMVIKQNKMRQKMLRHLEHGAWEKED